jgi:hypothetical protein
VVQRVRADGHLGAGGEPDAAEVDRPFGAAHEYPDRVPAQGLVDDLPGVDQFRHVVEGDGAAGEHLVELGVHALGDLGVLRELVEQPGQREGAGLDAGGQQGDDLVVDLLVGHPGAVVVAGQQQHGQQVASVDAVGTPVVDQPADDRPHAGDGPVELPVAPYQHLSDESRGQCADHALPDHHRNGGTRLIDGRAAELGAEQRLADNRHGECLHILVDFPNLTRSP